MSVFNTSTSHEITPVAGSARQLDGTPADLARPMDYPVEAALPRLRPADQVRAVLPQRVGAPRALLEPRGKLWHGLNAAAAGRSRSGRRARPIISMRSTRPTRGTRPARLEPERGGVSHTRRRAQAVPGEGKDRRGCTARRPASPARLLPGRCQRLHRRMRSSTSRAAVRRVFLRDQTAGKITPPITRTTTRPRISSAP